MPGNCAVSDLQNREVSAIEGVLVHIVAFETLLAVCYTEAVCHSEVSVNKRGIKTRFEFMHACMNKHIDNKYKGKLGILSLIMDQRTQKQRNKGAAKKL